MNITQEGEDQYQIQQEQQNIKYMSKIKQTKIPMTLTEDGVLKVAVEQGVIENEFNWKLVRERDGLTKESTKVMWLEFDEVGRFKDKYDTPAVGRSLIMSPFSQYFTWQTTIITEIVEERDDYVKFKTENSNYELWKLS
jgi:hypothetical protein